MLFVYKSQYSYRILRLVFTFQLPQGLAELEAEQEYEVFVDDEVDIIYITTPHNTHYEFMKAGRGCEPEKGITNWFRRAGNHLIKK